MIDLLASYGSARGVHLLAYYGDIQTAAAVFAANPRWPITPRRFMHAAEEGQESFVRLMLRYRPNCPARRGRRQERELNELLFQHGMNPSGPDWLGVTPLHRFAKKGDVANAASSSTTEPTCMPATMTSARRPWAGRPDSVSRAWSSCF